MMNIKLNSLAALTLTLAAGCSNAQTPPQGGAVTTETAQNPVDDALADAETGRDPAATQARLEVLLGEASLKKDDHGRVALALSRLVESAGDKGRAITLTEDAIASGNDDAEKRLFLLLTGQDAPSAWSRRSATGPVSASARAFAKYFPAATPDRKVEIEIDSFGGSEDHEVAGRGAFDVAGALRQNAIDACGLCEEVKTSIHTHSSGERLWSAIPRYAANLETALIVVYVDRATIPPERYARWLAAPLADIEAALDRGEGLIAVKERPGAPPLVTLVAPRLSQLGAVEAKLAEMSTLPLVPTKVAVDARLTPSEIQSAVRTRFGAFRACYESLLTQRPKAAGKIELAFAIDHDGKPRDVTVAVPPALDDAQLESCIATAAEKISYPAWSSDPKDTTTVRYPILVSP